MRSTQKIVPKGNGINIPSRTEIKQSDKEFRAYFAHTFYGPKFAVFLGRQS
jgi:hypothetical protein